MRPLAEWVPPSDLRGLLFDLDDTVTTDGKLGAEAYVALARAHEAGLRCVLITGRPAGWCDHLARMWPVDAVIGENGAFYFAYDSATRRLTTHFLDDEATRAAHRARLHEIAAHILREVPGTALASDQRYRETDLAIDHAEDVPPLGEAAVDRVLALMRATGLTAKLSSIHVNGWFGDHDKLGTTRLLLAERWGEALEHVRDHYVFVGDSPNDAPMFAFFPHAVGVANVRAYAHRLESPPAYVTTHPAGRGFAELVARLLGQCPKGVLPYRTE